MKLMDRYVREVGKHLPAKSRDDIQKELKSTLKRSRRGLAPPRALLTIQSK